MTGLQKATAVVTAVNNIGTPTVDVAMLGGTTPGLRYPPWYAPKVDDVVVVDWLGQQPYVAAAFAGATVAGAVQPFTSGSAYSSPSTGNSTCAIGVATCSATPIAIEHPALFSQISVEVTSPAAAGGVVRLGIYSDNGAGQPGPLLLDAGVVPTTTTGLVSITIAQLISPGLYWLAAQPEVAAATLRSVIGSVSGLWGLKAATGGIQLDGYFTSSGITAGALKDPYPATSQSPNLPKVFLRAA